MADQQGPTAPFPTPPPFYQHFTKQNILQLRELRRDAGVPQASAAAVLGDEAEKRDVDILSLPSELRYLIPPEPPASGKYESFGQDLNLDPPPVSLADAGIEQLYPTHPSVRLNPQPHLIALARSMLTSYLALTGVLGENPTLYEEKVQDLQTIAFNMHDLINQYRPHQARESLILMMEERLAEMKDEIRRIDESKDKVGKLLRDLQSIGASQMLLDEQEKMVEETELDVQEAKRRARQRAAWAALEKAMV